MYCKYYGFKEKPFNVTSDPAFFYMSRKHREAVACLNYGIDQRKGIIVLTGDIGIGKTTICRVLLSTLEKSVKTALVLNPYFSEVQLLEFIVRDFGITTSKKSRLGLITDLNKFLLEESSMGNNAVLIIDESQNLRARQLEQIRLLSNLETDKEKLLQIILVGQPELRQKLGLTELKQLKQRVMVDYHINPLQYEELKDYIAHRICVAKSNESVKVISFSDSALERIYKFSGGLPRIINHVCDRCLLAAFIQEKEHINDEIVTNCIRDICPDIQSGVNV